MLSLMFSINNHKLMFYWSMIKTVANIQLDQLIYKQTTKSICFVIDFSLNNPKLQ